MALGNLDVMNLQPLETPPLKVSRPVAACSRCRNAKIKCDGKLPACTSCEKNGRAAECTSTNDQFARGKERSYVSTLETRIDRLEADIRDAQIRKPSVVSTSENETPVSSRRPSEQTQLSYRQQSVQKAPTPTAGRKQKRREVSAIDDLVSDFGFLSVNATARDFHGFTQAMSYARLILWSCSKDDLPKGTSKALPSRNDGLALTQFYISNVFILLPAFEEASIWTAIDNVYSGGSRTSAALDHWMVRLIFAISDASMSRRSGDQHYLDSIGHICAALEYAEHVLHPGNISGIQALVLLAEYAMLAPYHFDSWQLIGAASRAMTDLGYHQDPPRGSHMLRSRLDLRRKVFYCIYVLDRSTSLVQTRAFSFSDASANVKVPFSKQHSKVSVSSEVSASSQAKDWLQASEQAADLVTLRKIQSSWYTELFQTSREAWNEPYPELWRMCADMQKWFENLSPSTPQNVRHFFELDLLYSYVYILSPSPRVPQIHHFAQKLIFEYCIRYTDLILHLISEPAYTAPLTFYDAMRVYMAGRQFVDILNHSIEMLLSGNIPSHPEIKSGGAHPPDVPLVAITPGETIQRFNTSRAINCIKQTIDCMGHFGLRWGYMSWHQRYEEESKAMLDNLQQRLRVLDETTRVRQHSMWGSNSSIPSSNGSIVYYSPPQSMAQGPTMYQQAAPQPPPKQPSFGNSDIPQQSSQLQMQPREQYPVQPGPMHGQMQPHYHQSQQPASSINFNDPTYQALSFSTAPSQQFAAWPGYGLSSGPDTLDEENASLYRTATPQSAQPQRSPRASVTWQDHTHPVPHRPSHHVATFDRQPRSSIVPPPAHLSVDENVPPGHYRQTSSSDPFYIPPAASLLPFSGTGPAYDEGMPPPPAWPRRISFQDASNDLMRATYPSAVGAPHSMQWDGMQSPRVYSSARGRRWKGKGRAGVTGYTPDPEHQSVGRVRWRAGVGYVCEVCSRVCWKPDVHRSGTNGSRCTDLSGWTAPLAREVEAHVEWSARMGVPQPTGYQMAMQQAQQHGLDQGLEGVPPAWGGDGGSTSSMPAAAGSAAMSTYPSAPMGATSGLQRPSAPQYDVAAWDWGRMSSGAGMLF